MATFEEILAQLGVMPGRPAAPPVPYDTSVMPGTAFGAPYPGAMPPMDTGIEGLGGAPAAAQTYGYNPQPRPILPPQLGAEGINPELFGQFRGLYAPPPPEQDPIAALLGTDRTAGMPGFQTAPPPSRALAPQWAQQGARNPQYGATEQPLTENERNLLRQSPAYGRAITRLRDLGARRDRMGMM